MKKLGAGATSHRIIHAAGVFAMVVMFETMLLFGLWLLLQVLPTDTTSLPPIPTAIGVVMGLLTALFFAGRAWLDSANLAWIADDHGALVVGRAGLSSRRIDRASRCTLVIESSEFTGLARHVRFSMVLRIPPDDLTLLMSGTRSDAAELRELVTRTCPECVVLEPRTGP